jgi:signal transduction histidine kinase
MGAEEMGAGVLALLAAYGLCCLLNGLGRYHLSRIALLTTVNLAVVIYAQALGRDSGVTNVFFFTLIAPFMLFHIREARKIAFCSAQPVIAWMLFHGPFGFGETGLFSPEETRLFNLFITFTMAILLVSCVLLIYLSHQKSLALLRHARDAAERSNRAKSEFLATMSHEIRTPMNGVLGSLQLLGMETLTPRQTGYLGLAQSCGNLLLAILNDILDFSKIESGRLDLECVDIDLGGILGEITEIHRPEADKKGLELSLEIDPRCPREIRGDPTRIRQIFLNLISNAIKFTKSGGVHVSMAKLEETEDKVRIVIRVRDTGIGISAEKMPLLFNAFTQLDSSTTREFGGTGLGLAIARKLALLMDGVLRVESRVGEGATFIFDCRFEKRARPEAGAYS